MEKNDRFSVERLQDVLKGKCKPGMLTYKYPELETPEVMKAIHTISVAINIPERRIRQAIECLIIREKARERVNELLNNLKLSVDKLNDAAIISSEAISNFANSNPFKNVNKPIDIDLCTEIIPDESHADLYDSLCGMQYGTTTGAEFFRQNIVDSQIYVLKRNYYTRERYESQHEIANRNRHTSRHVPFYFSIVGQNRHVPQKDGKKYKTKFNRNVRPKGTHSHSKFYR